MLKTSWFFHGAPTVVCGSFASARHLRLSQARRRSLLANAILTGLWIHAPSLFAGWIPYRDETATRLVADVSVGSHDRDEKSYAWGDVDHDGDVDVVCVRKRAWISPEGRPNVLFVNEGIREGHSTNGVLVDRTSEFARSASDGGQGFLDITNDRDVILVDVDNDGWLDIVTAPTASDSSPKTISHPRIYRNLGMILDRWAGFVYEENRIPMLTAPPDGASGAPRFGAVVAADVTGDGHPDLYFAGDEAGPPLVIDFNSRLLINDGHGFFFDSGSTILGEEKLTSTRCASACLVDIDVDGRLDVVRSESSNPNSSIHIDHHGTSPNQEFTVSTSLYHRAPLGVTCGDLNRDGRPDLVVTDAGPDRYLLNRGVGSEGKVTFSSHLFISPHDADISSRGSSVIVDLDDDGWNDVVITDVDVEFPGCAGRLHLYRNLGNPPNVTLQEQDAAPWTANGVHDVAVFDINGDGRKDLLIGTCRGTSVWIAEFPSGPRFVYPDGVPGFLAPGVPHGFRVRVADDMSMTSTGTQLYLSLNGSSYVNLSTTFLSQGLYFAVLPPSPCGAQIHWYLKGTMTNNNAFLDPYDAPLGANASVVAAGAEILFFDDATTELSGWTATEENVTFGGWERVTPIGTRNPTGGRDIAPSVDFTRGPGGEAFVTGNGPLGGVPSLSDLDGGPVSLTSPPLNLSGTDAFVSYAYWFYCNQVSGPEADVLTVDVSNDDGRSWVSVRTFRGSTDGWTIDSFRVGQFVHPTESVRVRFLTADTPSNSITEAAIDDFQVVALLCDQTTGAIIHSDPPSGAIDARKPSSSGSQDGSDWNTIHVTFDSSTYRPLPGHFAISPTNGSIQSPRIWKTTFDTPGPTQVWLTRPLEPGHRITLHHDDSRTFVNLGHLPGDVNADSFSDGTDVLALINQLSGFDTLGSIWSVDIDRSGQVNALDVPVLIDLLNGAGTLDPWLGRSLPGWGPD
ncbi:MAG: FG-GAP-like repeat-containing protein [Planctomycetota bacterium]